MIFGLKNMPCDLEFLLNDDVESPTAMIGKKMVPILQKDDGRYMAESMDIVHYIDQLDNSPVVTGPLSDHVSEWLNKVSHTVNQLAIPRTLNLPLAEFATEGARAFFTRAKTEWLGDFSQLLAKTDSLLTQINHDVLELEPLIRKTDAVNGTLSEDDFHLFATLRVLSAVAGVSYPSGVNAYRRRMSELSGVELLDSVAI